MAKGLSFNPYTTYADYDWQGDLKYREPLMYDGGTSVPTSVNQYYGAPQVNPVQTPALGTDIGNMKFQENDMNSISWGEVLNKWKKGFDGLDEEEKKAWELANAEKIAGKSKIWTERLWKNQLFADNIGEEQFNQAAAYNGVTRDKIYEDYVTSMATQQAFGDDYNIDRIQNLTPEGKQDLLKSGYKSNALINAEAKKREEEGFSSLSERWDSAVSGARTGAGSGAFVGGIVGTGGGVPGIIAGTAIGTLAGAVMGATTGFFSSTYGGEGIANRQRERNENILQKVIAADNERIKEDTKDETLKLYSQYLQAYRAGLYPDEQIEKDFDDLALNQKKTSVNSVGIEETYDYKGSNYYSAFKDSDEFDKFSIFSKLEQLARARVIENKYDTSAALSVLDQDMQNYVSTNQTATDWLGNTGQNILVGGVANLANTVVGIGALGAYVNYGIQHALGADVPTGAEALANYLRGKDASGNGEKNSFWLDPEYWEKVDQYNTFNRDYINKVDSNGGVSKYNNVVKAGEEGAFLSWNTANEALKMSKFAWSDLVKNLTLAKILNTSVTLAGGKYLSPGVLAKESTAFAKGLNKIGNYGIIGQSSIGIDVAYGMQTFKDVLDKNNQRLDAIIEQDTNAETQKIMESPEMQERFKQWVENENENRKSHVGENGTWFPVDEEKAYIDFYNSIKNKVREQQEASHTADRQQALNDAAEGYAWDASIEALRMSVTNSIFKRYLFDKGTLNAIRRNSNTASTTMKDGKYALATHATRKEAAKIIGANIFGGFQSNYFDDITVAFAKGLEIQDYNNYLMEKYNPGAYGSILDNVVNPYLAGMFTMSNAYTDGRSWLDGVVGALGAPLSTSYNIAGSLAFRSNANSRARQQAADEKAGVKTLKYGAIEAVSDWINNPVLEAIVEARERTRMADREIARANKALERNAYALDNMVPKAAALVQWDEAKGRGSQLDVHDAKDKALVATASELLDMKNNHAVSNAQAEPEKADWSKRKSFGWKVLSPILALGRIAESAGQGLINGTYAIAGKTRGDFLDSPYTIAMQQLKDIESMGAEVDDATRQRQQKIIDTFLGLEENRSIAQDDALSKEEKEQKAVELLKENGHQLQYMMDKMEKVKEAVSKSIITDPNYTHIFFDNPDIANQLVWQYTMADRWDKRSYGLEEKINPERQSTTSRNLVASAKYGSNKGYQAALKAQQERVDGIKKSLNALEKGEKNSYNPVLGMMVSMMTSRDRQALIKSEKERLQREEKNLQLIKAEERYFVDPVTKEETALDVLSAEDIIGLDAEIRFRILDPDHYDNYSVEQQAEIDNAMKLLTKDRYRNEVLEDLRDAATLHMRVEGNRITADNIMRNPELAGRLIEALRENRKHAVWDYFEDKIVGEKFDMLSKSTNVDSMTEIARSFSPAVVEAMQKRLNKIKNSEDLSDITIDNMKTALKNVVDERKKREKESEGILSHLKKTDKVEVTETNGDVQTTREENLTPEDRLMLGEAIAYANQTGKPLSEVRWGEVYSRINERNHQGLTEDWTTIPEDNGRFAMIRDAFINNYEQHKATVEKDSKPKEVSNNPKSVETTGEEERPDDSRKTFSEQLADLNKEKPQNDMTGIDKDVMDLALAKDETARMAGQIQQLLEGIDKLPMADKEASEAIKSNLMELLNDSSNVYDNIDALKKDLSDLMKSSDNALVRGLSTAVRNIKTDTKVQEKPAVKAEEAKDQQQEEKSMWDKALQDGGKIESIDITSLMDSKDPKWKVWQDYLRDHNVVSIINRLSSIFRDKDSRNNKAVRQFQTYFLYDAKLASDVAESMKKSGIVYDIERDAPVLMVLNVTNENKGLLDSSWKDKELSEISGLIKIEEQWGKKTQTYYLQPIGVLPANGNKNIEVTSTARFAPEIRKSIKTKTKVKNTVVDKTGTSQILKIGNTKISGMVTGIEHHTDYENGVHTGMDSSKGVITLLAENVNSPSEAIASDINQDELDKFNNARTPQERKNTDAYKNTRDAFIKRLRKVTTIKTATDDLTGETSSKKIESLKYNSDKNGEDRPISVFTRPISETEDRNTGDSMLNVLVNVLSTNDPIALNSAVETLKKSNSRFKRLFDRIAELKRIGEGLEGATKNEEQLNKIASSIQSILDNYLNVVGNPEFTATLKDNTIEVKVTVRGKEISTLPIEVGKAVNDVNLAKFVANLILEPAEGDVSINGTGYKFRPNPVNPEYGLVKWQVPYGDVDAIVNNASNETNAMNNLRDIVDDGILYMNVNKLAYPVNTTTIELNNRALSKWKPSPEAPKESPTGGIKPTVVDGQTIDPNTGAVQGKPDGSTKGNPPTSIQQKVLNSLKTIADKVRGLKPNANAYNIDGAFWARVTKVKHAIEGREIEKFPENSPTKTPSTVLGTTFDDFARDIFNGLYEDVKDNTKLRKLFDERYPNSSADNYLKVAAKLLAFKASISQNETIVDTGANKGTDEYDRGQIVVNGILKALGKDASGKDISTDLRVAGTVDLLSVNRDGDIVIYDFKTHHRDKFDRAYAEKMGYDIQLSLYALFLEKMLADMGITKDNGDPIKVVGIHILPAKVHYDLNNTSYKEMGGSLMMSKDGGKTWTNFNDANFEVEDVVDLDRLTGDKLSVALEKLGAEEKENLKEAFQDQAEDKAQPDPAKEVEVELPEEDKKGAPEEESKVVTQVQRRKFSRPNNQAAEAKPIGDGKASETIQKEGSVADKVEDQKNKCNNR